MLTSCTVIFPVVSMQKSAKNKVTHADKMSRYSTKNDVLNAFGMPTEKDNFSGKEIWYYNLGSVSVSNTNINGNRNTNINSDYSGINVNTKANARGTTRTSSYNKYVEFHFNGDYVTNWRSQGIDYGNKNQRVAKAALSSLGGMALDCVGILLLMNGNEDTAVW